MRRRHAKFADIDLGVIDFVQVQVARKLPKPDREQRRRQIAHEPSLQAQLSACRAPDMHFAVGSVERCEEAQALTQDDATNRERMR